MRRKCLRGQRSLSRTTDSSTKNNVTLGFLNRVAMSIVHTETEDEIRIISFRKATKNEEVILFKSIEDQLDPG